VSEPDLDRFESRRSTVYAPNGIVATSQPLAAQAGVSVLRDGGNAFDAAVATAAALNVVEPTSTGVGGDVFALYRTADGDVGAMRSCGGAPEAATLDAVREAASGPDDDPAEATMPEAGPLTVTVPGTARGWEATLAELGTVDLERALRPAIRFATEGYPVTEVVASAWRDAADTLVDETARETYLFDGEGPRAGQRVALPEIGRTLERIAAEGADVVYEGAIGDAIVEAVRSRGGFLSRDDLRSFRPEFVDPVETTYRGTEVYELPPNNQGLIALEALNVAEEIGAHERSFGSPAYVHALVESMRLAFADGHRYVADPDYESVPPLASRAWARRRAAEVGETASADVTFGVPGANAEDADTVLLTVGDADGNLVSYINSRFRDFGSGIVAGDTGIALQNRGSSFSLDPAHPNRIEPGKRPFHTLLPAMARFGPDDWAAFGVMGGFMQPQGHVQVLTNLVDGGVPLQAALDRPRWRVRESGQLAVEARTDDDLVSKLVRRGHDVRVDPPHDFGGAQIVRNEGGVLSGASEPRKDGAAIGF